MQRAEASAEARPLTALATSFYDRVFGFCRAAGSGRQEAEQLLHAAIRQQGVDAATLHVLDEELGRCYPACIAADPTIAAAVRTWTRAGVASTVSSAHAVSIMAADAPAIVRERLGDTTVARFVPLHKGEALIGVLGLVGAPTTVEAPPELVVQATNLLIAMRLSQAVRESSRQKADLEQVKTRLVSVLQDLESRQQTIEAVNASLQVSESRFRNLSTAAPVGVFETGRDGELVYANPELLRLVGMELEDACGRTWLDAVHEADRERVSEIFQSDNADLHSRISCDFRILNRRGDAFWVDLQAVAAGVTPRTPQYIGTLMDYTERKHLEGERERLHRRLVDASRQAGMADVATGVLHNVGNTLNSLNVSTARIAEKLEATAIPQLEKIGALIADNASDLDAFVAGEKIKPLLMYLQKLSVTLCAERHALAEEMRATRGSVEHIKRIVEVQQSMAAPVSVTELVSLADLVEEALFVEEGAFGERQISVERDYGANPSVMIDRHKVRQVLLTLLSNARRAVEACSPPRRRVRVAISVAEGGTVVSVADRGIGIADALRDAIFQNGFSGWGGNGFGLHEAALAAASAGGRLTVESEGLDQGARFMLLLRKVQSDSSFAR